LPAGCVQSTEDSEKRLNSLSSFQITPSASLVPRKRSRRIVVVVDRIVCGGFTQGDYHIPEAFLTKFCVHITKNFLNDGGYITDNVPLILGIWGHKGCGKSFNAELACKAMGIHPIIMSAGELEDMWAGTPGKLIRERYRRAAEVVKNHGKMCCLVGTKSVLCLYSGYNLLSLIFCLGLPIRL
jgi:hypothetical protein